MRRAATVLALLVGAQAFAWDSRCYRESGGECTPGPESARNRWIGPSDEHRALFVLSRIFGGLPATVAQGFDLPVFTGDTLVAVAGGSLPSLQPVAFIQTALVQERAMTAAEFAQLPDHAYALWDWALGNETCPLADALPANPGAEDCHAFKTHMGPVNSNHFLPQGAYFYDHYHELALARAATCAAMTTKLGAAASQFTVFPRACLDEALVLEAIGQHFLQDAWATGHMWERWGSPDLADFPSRTHALLVAMTSGLIHGARAVLEELALDPAFAALGLIGFHFDDPLNAPHPDVQWLVPGDPLPHPGLGDLYLIDLIALQGQGFPDQYRRLLSCGAAGLRAVYQAAGEPDGPLGSLAPALFAVDPASPGCFGQRATNLALVRGMGLDVTTPNGTPLRLELDSQVATQLVPQLSAQAGGNPTASLTAQYQIDVASIVSIAKLTALADPTGTALASGVLPPLIGVPANGTMVKTPLAAYVDPPLPWPGAAAGSDGERASALARTFHRAHAIDWCNRFHAGDPASLDVVALRDRVAALKAGGATMPVVEAACAACEEFAARHLRVGTSGDYDTAREPLCHFLADDPSAAQYVYQEGEPADPLASLVTSYCGCTPCTLQPVNLALDFGQGEDDPTVTGPVLDANVTYRVTVAGTLSIWTTQWQNGVCLGSPAGGVGGQTGLDAEYWFAIPVGSSLCDEFANDPFPNSTSKFEISTDDGASFDHPTAVDPAYDAAHNYEYLVTGQGQAIQFREVEGSNRDDDYGVLSITVACE